MYQLFPVPFRLIPRSPKRERIMREEWVQAEKAGVDFTGSRFEKI